MADFEDIKRAVDSSFGADLRHWGVPTERIEGAIDAAANDIWTSESAAEMAKDTEDCRMLTVAVENGILPKFIMNDAFCNPILMNAAKRYVMENESDNSHKMGKVELGEDEVEVIYQKFSDLAVEELRFFLSTASEVASALLVKGPQGFEDCNLAKIFLQAFDDGHILAANVAGGLAAPHEAKSQILRLVSKGILSSPIER